MENKKELLVREKQEVSQKINKNLADRVFESLTVREEKGMLDIPKNYSVSNALTSFYFEAQNAVGFSKATQSSIAEAMMKMVSLGLTPTKNQVYPIVYGDKMTCFVSYFGRIALVDRLKGTERSPRAVIIYEGDEVDIKINDGMVIVENHTTSWENVQKGNIVGAYATMKYNGQEEHEVMTLAQIKEAWGGAKGSSGNERAKFTTEFVKRTVLNRLTKRIINTSNDEDLLLTEQIAKLDEEHYDFSQDTTRDVEIEIKENANTGEVIDFEEPKKAKEEDKQQEIIDIVDDVDVPF